jgi:hypothetical protein
MGQQCGDCGMLKQHIQQDKVINSWLRLHGAGG